MQPIPILAPQRSEEWFKARLGRVTGSRVADVMAWGKRNAELAPRKQYKRELVAERLTGVQADPEPYLSYEMKWGMANERIARTVYQMRSRLVVEDAPFYQHPELMAGASPDGLINDDGLIEIKCPRSDNHFDTMLVQEVPDKYMPQIQMQLWITGRLWCDFVEFDSRAPEGLKIFVQRVDRDEDYINLLESEVRKFLDEVDAKEGVLRDLAAFQLNLEAKKDAKNN